MRIVKMKNIDETNKKLSKKIARNKSSVCELYEYSRLRNYNVGRNVKCKQNVQQKDGVREREREKMLQFCVTLYAAK